MSPLFLHCALCGRKQADGLLSRAAWGELELDDGRTVRACAPCASARPDWREHLRGLFASPAPTVGTAERPATVVARAYPAR